MFVNMSINTQHLSYYPGMCRVNAHIWAVDFIFINVSLLFHLATFDKLVILLRENLTTNHLLSNELQIIKSQYNKNYGYTELMFTGIIKLKNNGDFFIANEGRRPIYIDGRPVLSGNKWKLNNNSVVEVCAELIQSYSVYLNGH